MRLPLAILLIALAHPVLAGTRVVYLDQDKKRIVVEVAYNGDARITPEQSQQYGVLRGGDFYVIGREQGVLKVARVADVAAAVDQVMPPVFKNLFGSATPAPSSPLRFEPKGSRTVDGRAASVYAVYGMDAARPNEPAELLVSKDPALRPVGKAMEQYLVGTTVLLVSFMGPVAAEIVKDMRAIFALGTPLDIAGRYRLVEADKADIGHEATELPGKPQTVEQLVAAMRKDGMGAPPSEPAPDEATYEAPADAGEAVSEELEIEMPSELDTEMNLEPGQGR